MYTNVSEASRKSRKFLNSLEHLKWLRTLLITLKLVLFLLNFPFKAIKGVLSHLSHLRNFLTFLMNTKSEPSWPITRKLVKSLSPSAKNPACIENFKKRIFRLFLFYYLFYFTDSLQHLYKTLSTLDVYLDELWLELIKRHGVEVGASAI